MGSKSLFSAIHEIAGKHGLYQDRMSFYTVIPSLIASNLGSRSSVSLDQAALPDGLMGEGEFVSADDEKLASTWPPCSSVPGHQEESQSNHQRHEQRRSLGKD